MASGKPSSNDAGGKKRAAGERASGRKGSKKRESDLDELFVDPAPPEREGKRSGRAADRRRERGQAPQGAGPPDTRMSLRQKERPAPEPSQHSMSVGASPIATLTCIRGPEEGLALQLIEGSYTIGRARENSFVLKDIAASRRHVRIDIDRRGARMTDLGSGNGSRLNGRRVSEAELRHGDRIEIGGSVLLFAESGRDAPKPDGLADEAQERVIRAAEKLAAELSERMRFGESENPGFEDGHIARTRALPAANKEHIHEELKRQAEQQKQSGKKLWNETLSNLPLNEIIPADDPLRGPRAGEKQAAPQPTYQPPVRVAQPPPRPLPAPQPPELEPSLSHSRGAGSSFLLPLLVSALVVILGGAAVLGVYWYTQRDGRNARAAQAQAHEVQFNEAMDGAERSMLQEDWTGVLEYATLALQHKPGDATALRYQSKAREKIAARLAPETPPPAPPEAAAAAQNGAAASAQATNPTQPANGQPANGQPANAQPANAQPANAQAANPPVANAQPANASAPANTAAPSEQPANAPAPKASAAPRTKPRDPAPPASASRPKVREPAPAPAAPKEKKGGKGKKMSEEQAKTAFMEAVDLLRNEDSDAGCALLERVARDAPADSKWSEKADSLLERRCN